MPNEYLRINDTQLNIKKAENLLAIIEDKRKDAIERKEVQSESSLFNELFKAFKLFFSNLGKPTIQKKYLKEGAPARSSDYNDRMKEIYNDINVAYTETDSLSSVVVKDFNYSESERQMLLNKVKKMASDSTDYSFYSTGAKTKSIFAIDSFVDNSKVDFSKIGAGSQAAELITNQGVVTLKRLGNIDRSTLVERVTGVKESIPEWNPAGEYGGYEGLYFGIRNEPRPEGGIFHVTYSADGSRLFENGASEEEKMPRRLQMFDNNPDTFWEVEYLTTPIIGYKDKYTGNQISVAEFNELIQNELSSPGVTTTAGTVVTSEKGNLIEDYVPVTATTQLDYLNCSFVVFFSRAENINWISLNPNNFGHENYMEVLSIQTSPDGQKFEELEGFDDYEYETMLTKQANSELTPYEVQATLSPDQFKYAGQGVWVFSPRVAKAIKFELRQTRPYLKQYEVLIIELQQTVTTTVTTTPSAWDQFWGADTETSTSTQVITQQVEIPYLTGHYVGFDILSLEQGSASATQSGNEVSIANVVGGVAGAAGGAWAGFSLGGSVGGPVGAVIGGIAGGIMGWLFGDMFESSTQTSTSVSPQTMSRQWTKIKDDRSRFAIGIRDINIYSYQFAESSEIVSKPYLSPAPISKLALQVEEQIPKKFYESNAGTENDWIKYYISVDNGASWNRISPTHHKTTISDDGANAVPEIVNINSDVPQAERKNPLAYIDTASPVYSVRFKAALSRPTDIAYSDSYTPVLSQYSLQIYPVGGL